MAIDRTNKEWISIGEAAALLSVHVNTIRRYVRENRIEGRKLGPAAQHPWRLRRASVEALVTGDSAYKDQLAHAV